MHEVFLFLSKKNKFSAQKKKAEKLVILKYWNISNRNMAEIALTP